MKEDKNPFRHFVSDKPPESKKSERETSCSKSETYIFKYWRESNGS